MVKIPTKIPAIVAQSWLDKDFYYIDCRPPMNWISAYTIRSSSAGLQHIKQNQIAVFRNFHSCFVLHRWYSNLWSFRNKPEQLDHKFPLGHKPFLLPQEQYNMVLIVSWFYHLLLKKYFPCFDVEATEEAAAIPCERLRRDASRS